jgi:hypothetical protein
VDVLAEEKYDSDYIKKIVGMLKAHEQKMKEVFSGCAKNYKIKCR